nr:MAG TPA: dUTPase [Caudoviricetes sp.]
MIKLHNYLIFDKDHKLIRQVSSDLTPYKWMASHTDDCPDAALFVDISNGDVLNNLLTLQYNFQARLGQLPLEPGEQTQYVMNNMLYTEAEGHEFLREIEGFKSWKHYDWSQDEKDKHYKAALEEFVDMLHFVLNIALAMGFSGDDIYEAYVAKNIVNHKRQDNGY